jgi:hypothetical protein
MFLFEVDQDPYASLLVTVDLFKIPFISRFISPFYTVFMLCVLCFYNHTEYSFLGINHNGTAYAISASVTPWSRSNFHAKMRPQNLRPLAYSKYNIVIKEIT